MKIIFDKQRGLTLVEVTVAMAIFVVSSLVIVSLFIYHAKLFQIEERVSSLKINKSLFTKNFNEAGGAASAVIASWNIGGTPYVSSSSTVVFKIPAVDLSGNLLANLFDYVVFYRDAGNVLMKTEAAAGSRKKSGQKLLASSAENLIFRYNSASPQDASLIEAFLYLKTGSSRELISTSALLRNK